MAIVWWPHGKGVPSSVTDFKLMSDTEFEHFSVEVLKKYYAPYGVAIANTRPSKDGGRDGEGSLRIGGGALDGALDIELKIWVEAKHHTENVGLKTVGGHVCAALIEDVQKIVFVASGGFTKPTKEKLEKFALRTGLRCSFVNGKDILGIFKNLDFTEAHEAQAVSSRISEPALTVEAISFSSYVNLSEYRSSTRQIKHGEPVFVIVRAKLDLPEPQDGIMLTARFGEPDGTLLPSLGERTLKLVGPNETLERVFVFHPPTPGLYRVDEVVVQCMIGSGRLLTAPRFTCTDTLDVLPNMLPFVPTPSQSRIAKNLAQAFETWVDNRGPIARAIEAPAGHGKSRLLAQARSLWLDRGLKEIHLDGGVEVDEWYCFLAVFSHVLPVDRGELDVTHYDPLYKWLSNAGVEGSLAEQLAQSICNGKFNRDTFSSRMLGDLMASLLNKCAPVVVLFEDLHKVTHGLLRLLRETLFALDRRGVDVFVLFTSRYEPLGADAMDVDAWKTEKNLLLRDERVVTERIELPSKTICGALLRHALPDLADHDIAAIVDQVGVSPFNLAESLHYLRKVGVIEWDRLLGRDVILNPAALRERIYAETLTDVTAKRLALLKNCSPAWAADLLDLAGCLGREFSLAWAIRATAANVSERDLDGFLATCMRESVLSPTGRARGSDWRFDHDLVRYATLNELTKNQRPRHMRLASELLKTLDASVVTPFQQLALSYQAGHGDTFVGEAQQLAEGLLSHSRHADAADLLDTVACVLDVTRTVREDRHRLDDSFVLSPIPELTGLGLSDQHDGTILDVLWKRIGALAAITSGSSPDLEADLTIAEMYAERQPNRLAKACFRGYWGQLLLERGNESEALDRHQDAERLFAQLPVVDTSARRADNLIRMAIAFRHLGQPEQSKETLNLAIEIGGSDPELHIRRLANMGALYFYTDVVERRRYWLEAYEIAQRTDCEHLRIHMALDLANLDILEDQWSSAVDRVEDALDSATRHGLANSLLRSYVLRAAIDLHECEPGSAWARLSKAYQIAIAHSIDRRAWKITGNMALTQEMLGDIEKAYLYDRRTVGLLLQTKIDKRAGIPLGNIALRASFSEFHKELLLQLSPAEREVAHSLARAIEAPGDGIFPTEHCKIIDGKRRYLMT